MSEVAVRIFRFFCSLKLAVCVLLSFAASLATGTILESLYDTPTAQFWVYRSLWFHLLLTTLGINIFCVAMSRYPWKVRHLPFLLAHLGILTLLTGALITERIGFDGSLRITEGETAGSVEMEEAILSLSDSQGSRSIVVPWIPPDVKFKTIALPYDLQIDRYLSHSEPKFSFLPHEGGAPAVRLKLAVNRAMAGKSMAGISQDIWLWAGSANWTSTQAGAGRFFIGTTPPAGTPGPWLAVLPEKNGDLGYLAFSSKGEQRKGRIRKGNILGAKIDAGWKVLSISVGEWIPEAMSQVEYIPAHFQYGKDAPPPAIHLSSTGKASQKNAEIWLGLGDQAALKDKGADIQISFHPKTAALPFALKLNHFMIEHYEGTNNPSSFASNVTIVGSDTAPKDPITISMNEPLKEGGFTFYQASYEEAEPRPVTTILSVNRDPGRWLKYLGSLLLVGGTILLFVMRKMKLRQEIKATAVSAKVAKGLSTGVLT